MESILRVFAQTSLGVNCTALPNEGSACNGDTGLPKVGATALNLQNIFQIVFGIIGAAAIIVIIVSAINLAASQGDPQALTKARQAIIFASIGLAIALSAELIISFVLLKV